MVGAVGIIPVLQAQLIRQHVVAAELPLPMGEEVLRGGQGLQAKGRKAQGADTADGLLLGKRALRVGKFVEPCEKALFRPLPKGDFFLVVDEKDRVMADGPGLLLRHLRKAGCGAVLSGSTKRRKGAFVAERLPVGPADAGAQVHQRLIEVSGAAGRNAVGKKGEGFAAGGGLPDALLVGREPGEDPEEVSVDGGHRLVKGDGGNGCCRIGTDAGDLFQLCRGSRHFPVMRRQNLFGALMEVPYPGVVAEALPEL